MIYAGFHRFGRRKLLFSSSPTNAQTPSRIDFLRLQLANMRAKATQWIGSGSFSRDASGAFALHIFSAAVGLITTVLLARLIGAAHYGVYAVAIVYANVFAFLACFGFPQLIIRTEARQRSQSSDATGRSVQATALATAIGVGLTLTLAGCYFASVLVPYSSPAATGAFWLAMLLVVPMAVQRLREATLLGRHHTLESLLPERLIRPISMLVLVLVLAFLFGTDLTSRGAVFAQGAACIVALASVFILASRNGLNVPSLDRSLIDQTQLRAALPFLLVGLTTLLAGRVDIMMLGVLADAKTVGQYRLAAQIAAIIMMLTTVSQSVLSPRISKRSHDQDLVGLVSHLPKLCVALFASAAVLSVVIYSGFHLVLPWLGADFNNAAPILLILLIAFTIIAALSPALPLLTMSGHAKYAAIANVAAIVLNISLNIILVPVFEGQGAALATAISLVSLYGLYTVLAMHRVLGAHA